MSTLILNTTFNNTSLPSAKSLSERISELDGLVSWFQADPSHLSVVGDSVISMKDRAGGVSKMISNNAHAKILPVGIGNYSSALFLGSTVGENSSYSLSGADVNTDLDYTFVALFKPGDVDNGDTIVGRFESSSERVLLNIPSGTSKKVRLYHGTSTGIEHPVQVGKWCLVIGAHDSENGLLKMFADGITYPPSAVSGNSGVAATINIGALNAAGGQAFDGELSDLMIFSRDVFQTSSDLDLIKSYFSNVYGIPE